MKLEPVRYVLVLPNEHVSYHVAMMKRDPSYADIKAIVLPLLQCEYLEHVSTVYDPILGFFPLIKDSRPLDMFVDELGHAHGLPYNMLATQLYYVNTVRQGGPRPNPKIDPVIVGPAVVFGRKVWS